MNEILGELYSAHRRGVYVLDSYDLVAGGNDAALADHNHLHHGAIYLGYRGFDP